MKILKVVTLVLIIVGGLNWGLVGAAKFNLVATLFGADSMLSNLVYILVGISAIVQAILLFVPESTPTHAHSH